ncbi:hypothetical protein KOM00_20375 [Geomonas sp. Red69]|uniref:Lipoprotein n=1 Tax=Geomonas diazotrophica TaxID=2843197 RepID=A0ABX8JHU9_9BACT|nr:MULTISPECIES: hypothetical protein [Geomonas]MBU5639082.1 hypothetical protein [Geomonas diazotrophica]QWV97958.1 hypothetical protein KP005_01275 [Geomonas nitrogeniifigens]QXE87089.1 hypothetical protein KP003_01375 [Geomonas nitrogeniifigens]
MMKVNKILVAALVLSSVVAGVSGCRKEGPAERAGKEIDKSVEKAGKEIEKAGAKLNDAVNQMKK